MDIHGDEDRNSAEETKEGEECLAVSTMLTETKRNDTTGTYKDERIRRCKVSSSLSNRRYIAMLYPIGRAER